MVAVAPVQAHTSTSLLAFFRLTHVNKGFDVLNLRIRMYTVEHFVVYCCGVGVARDVASS